MWERFAEVVKSDDDELERNAEGASEITQKENEAGKRIGPSRPSRWSTRN